MRIEEQQLKDIRSTPLQEVVRRMGVKVNRGRVLCPWHADKHESLYMTRSGRGVCFSCGARTDAISYLMKVLNLDFRGACEWLADGQIREEVPEKPRWEPRPFDATRYGRYLEHPVLNILHKTWLFGERHYSPWVAEWLRLNSYREWLQIPYWAADGRTLIGLQSRYMGNDPEQPRFKFVPGSRCNTYNLGILPHIRDDDEVWLAEGVSDTWAHLSAGHKCLGIASATLLREEDLRPLAGHRVRCAPDRDQAGARLVAQIKAVAGRIGFELVVEELPEGCKDYSDYWKQLFIQQYY